MSDKQITPEQALILRIVEQWGNVVNMPKMEQWLKDYAASQQPAVKAIDATPFETNTDRQSVTGLTTGEYELAFIPCAEDDPRSVGGFTSDDGQSLCHVRELHLPVVKGLQWVKAEQKPEHNAGVLVFIPGEDNHITSGMWDISNKWVLLDEYRKPDCEVTHWMPLPPYPEGYPDYEIPSGIAAALKEIAKQEIPKYPFKADNESPTAAGDGKEDAVAFLDWYNGDRLKYVAAEAARGKQEYHRARNLTHGELYDIYLTDKNK